MSRRWSLSVQLIIIASLFGCQNQGFQVIEDNTPPSQSPFESSGSRVITDPNLPVTPIVLPIPKTEEKVFGFPYDFVIDDICIKARLSSTNSNVEYFIDRFIDNRKLAESNQKIRETIVTAVFSKVPNQKILEHIARVDRCIVGVTNRTILKIKSSSSSDSLQKVDYLSQIGFAQARSFLTNELGSSIKVKVAVVDSGFETLNSMGAKISNDLSGSNILEENSLPNDELGHGTEVISVLSRRPDAVPGTEALVHDNIEIIPVKLFGAKRTQELTAAQFHEAIKRSVNLGAEVINLSFEFVVDDELDNQLKFRGSPSKLDCPVSIGHALQRAIERKSLVVMSAGHGTSYEKYQTGEYAGQWKFYRINEVGEFLKSSNGSLMLCDPKGDKKNCDRRSVAGPVLTVQQNGMRTYGNTSAPACWSSYLKGAISVGASTGDGKSIADFSNYGPKGVEIVAPGVGIETTSIAGRRVIRQGTSFSAPLVVGSAVMAIGFHKKMQNLASTDRERAQWSYSPWYIEDLILNFSTSEANLSQTQNLFKTDPLVLNTRTYQHLDIPDGAHAIKKGRRLRLDQLAAGLLSFKAMSFEQRRRVQTENNEVGAGYRIGENRDPSSTLNALQVYSENFIVRDQDRVQIQGVAIYDQGETRVVTPQISWSISDSRVAIDSQGVIYPQLGFKGLITITGTYQTKSGTTQVLVTDQDVISGSRSQIPESIQIEWLTEKSDCSQMSFQAFAKYDETERVNVTHLVSWTVQDSKYKPLTAANHVSMTLKRQNSTPADEPVTVTAHLYGKKGVYNFTAPLCRLISSDIFVRKFKNGEVSDSSKSELKSNQELSLSSTEVGPATLIFSQLCANDFNKNLSECFLTTDLKNSTLPSSFYTGTIFTPVRISTTVPYSFATLLSLNSHTSSLPLGHQRFSFDVPLGWTGTNQIFRALIDLEIRPVTLMAIEIKGPKYQTSKDPLNPTLLYSSGTFYVIGQYNDGSQRSLGSSEYKLEARDQVTRGHLLQTSATKSPSVEGGFNFYSLEPAAQVSGEIQATVLSQPSLKATFKYRIEQNRQAPDVSLTKRMTAALLDQGISIYSGLKVFRDRIDNIRLPKTECSAAVPSGQVFVQGDGSLAKPYLICTKEQFLDATDPSKVGNISHFILGSHIDLSNTAVVRPLAGSSLDGQGYELKNFSHLGMDRHFSGLFNVHKLKNVVFRNFIVQSDDGNSTAINGFSGTSENIVIIDSNFAGGPLFSSLTANGFHLINVRYDGRRNMLGISGSLINSSLNVEVNGSATSPSRGLFGGSNSLNINSSCFPLTDQKFELAECRAGFMNVFLKLKLRSAGSGVGGLVDSHQSPFLVNIDGSIDLEGASDQVGGLIGVASSPGYSNQSVISNVNLSGYVRGRNSVGGLIGHSASVRIDRVSLNLAVFGSDGVGGAIGSLATLRNTILISNSNLSQVQLTANTNYSDLIGRIEQKSSRGDLMGPKNEFRAPIVLWNNQSRGSFISDQEAALTQALTQVMSNR